MTSVSLAGLPSIEHPAIMAPAVSSAAPGAVLPASGTCFHAVLAAKQAEESGARGQPDPDPRQLRPGPFGEPSQEGGADGGGQPSPGTGVPLPGRPVAGEPAPLNDSALLSAMNAASMTTGPSSGDRADAAAAGSTTEGPSHPEVASAEDLSVTSAAAAQSDGPGCAGGAALPEGSVPCRAPVAPVTPLPLRSELGPGGRESRSPVPTVGDPASGVPDRGGEARAVGASRSPEPDARSSPGGTASVARSPAPAAWTRSRRGDPHTASSVWASALAGAERQVSAGASSPVWQWPAAAAPAEPVPSVEPLPTDTTGVPPWPQPLKDTSKAIPPTDAATESGSLVAVDARGSTGTSPSATAGGRLPESPWGTGDSEASLLVGAARAMAQSPSDVKTPGRAVSEAKDGFEAATGTSAANAPLSGDPAPPRAPVAAPFAQPRAVLAPATAAFGRGPVAGVTGTNEPSALRDDATRASAGRAAGSGREVASKAVEPPALGSVRRPPSTTNALTGSPGHGAGPEADGQASSQADGLPGTSVAWGQPLTTSAVSTDNTLTPAGHGTVGPMTSTLPSTTVAPSATSASSANITLIRQAAHGDVDLGVLGRVTVTATGHDGGVDVKISTARSAASEALVPHAPAIEADVRQANVPLLRLEIASQQHHGAGSQGESSRAGGDPEPRDRREQPARPAASGGADSEVAGTRHGRVRIVL